MVHIVVPTASGHRSIQGGGVRSGGEHRRRAVLAVEDGTPQAMRLRGEDVLRVSDGANPITTNELSLELSRPPLRVSGKDPYVRERSHNQFRRGVEMEQTDQSLDSSPPRRLLAGTLHTSQTNRPARRHRPPEEEVLGRGRQMDPSGQLSAEGSRGARLIDDDTQDSIEADVDEVDDGLVENALVNLATCHQQVTGLEGIRESHNAHCVTGNRKEAVSRGRPLPDLLHQSDGRGLWFNALRTRREDEAEPDGAIGAAAGCVVITARRRL